MRAYFTRPPRRNTPETTERPPVADEVWIVSVGKEPVMCLTRGDQVPLAVSSIISKYNVPQHSVTVVKVPVVP